jgi:integrase
MALYPAAQQYYSCNSLHIKATKSYYFALIQKQSVMSRKGQITTTNAMEWNSMLGLLHRLKQDGKHHDYLIICCGCFMGMRIGDLLRLRWCDVLGKTDFIINEQKTGKQRRITVHETVKEALSFVSAERMKKRKFDREGYLFINRWGEPLTRCYVNRRLKAVFTEYNIKVQNPSSHTLRKTFGRRVWDSNGRSESSLVYLSEIFSHSSLQVTRLYLGITQAAIADVYMKL